jgi:hypothetical protein
MDELVSMFVIIIHHHRLHHQQQRGGREMTDREQEGGREMGWPRQASLGRRAQGRRGEER